MSECLEKILPWLTFLLALTFFFVEKVVFSMTDVFSDIAFAVQMIVLSPEDILDGWKIKWSFDISGTSTAWKDNASIVLNMYGQAMFFPILCSLISLLPHLYVKKGLLRLKIFEFVLVLLQCYPQYIAIRLMVAVARDNNPWINQDGKFSKDEWEKKKDTYEREIGCNEAILEALLQFNIVLIGGRIFLEGTIPQEDFSEVSESFFFGTILNLTNYQAYVFTIVISTVSGAWGLSKFWKLYILRGHSSVSCSFFLTFCLCSLYCFRAAIGVNLCVLSSYYTGFVGLSNVPGNTLTYFWMIIFLLMVVPPIVWSWIHLHKNFTVKEHWKFLLKYPGYFVAPAFSPFILESVILDNEIKKQVRVSPVATIVNSIWLYLVPNIILYGWVRHDTANNGVYQTNFRHNATIWPDETMKAVVFGIDPPYEILLVSAIFSMLAVALLVTKRTFPGCPMLTDVFIEDTGHKTSTIQMSDLPAKTETKEESSSVSQPETALQI